MRHRDLAAVAVTATVAATPTLATVIEEVTTAPPAAADIVPAGQCNLTSPSRFGTAVTTSAFSFDPYGACASGTLSVQASADHSHWKTIAERHQDSWSGQSVTGQCLSGTWWYQGYYVTDDGSFKGGTDSAAPTQFKC